MYRILLLDAYKYNKIKHNQMFFSKVWYEYENWWIWRKSLEWKRDLSFSEGRRYDNVRRLLWQLWQPHTILIAQWIRIRKNLWLHHCLWPERKKKQVMLILALRSKILFHNIFLFLAQCSLRSSIIAYRSVTLDWPPVSWCIMHSGIELEKLFHNRSR